jgi:predicted porin
MAQSNVTIYGLIEMSVTYARFNQTPSRPASHLYTLSSDASRLGFRGLEDLGGGRRAYFKLEHGVSLDAGTQTNATQFWNREAYVGLGDRTFGSIQLGSQYTPEITTSGKVDPFGRFGLGAILGLLQGSPRGWAQAYNNAVQYLTPDIYGVQGRLIAAAGEGTTAGRSAAGAIEYARGPLYAAVNYDDIHVTAASVGLPGNLVKTRTYSVGATYDFSVVKIAGWWQTNRINGLPKANGYMLGATVPVGTGEIRASYSHRSLTNADATQMVLGYHYYLSKRTALFSQVGRTLNSGTAAFGLGPARTEEAAAGQLAAGRDITGVQLGMRHLF